MIGGMRQSAGGGFGVNGATLDRARGLVSRLTGQSAAIPARESLNWGGQLLRQFAPKIASPLFSAANTMTNTIQQPQGAMQTQAADAVTARAATSAKVDARTLAMLSSDVYKTDAASLPPSGWRQANAQDLAKLNLTPAMMSDKASGFYARVYTTGQGDEAHYVVAFRGSEMELNDWTNNFKQALGGQSDQYAKAMAIGKALSKTGQLPVVMTGHSLGGGLASASAIASGRNAATFNASGLSNNTIQQARSIAMANSVQTREQVSAYYNSRDPLSLIQDGGDRMAAGAATFLATWNPQKAISAFKGGDLPGAYGDRIFLDTVAPAGTSWLAKLNPINPHSISWVEASLDSAIRAGKAPPSVEIMAQAR